MGALKGPIDGLKQVSGYAEDANESIKELTETITDGNDTFAKMYKAANIAATSISALSGALEKMGESIPGGDVLFDFLNYGIETMSEAAQGTAELANTYFQAMGAIDAFSAGHRKLYADMSAMGGLFGKNYSEMQNFANGLLEMQTNSELVRAGLLKPEDFQKTITALSENNVSYERFGDVIMSDAGAMDFLTASTLQAGSSGLQTSTYFSMLADAIQKQGMSSQKAMEQMASFRDISKDTSLSVQTVADSLMNMADEFSTLGLSADFGKPMLLGFANTLKTMGLGIQNATSLSASLSKSLAGLAQNYSMMYLTAQKGNLQDLMGGGGILSAGIKMQAKMLDSEGDPEKQAAVGKELVGALRDTIKSFTGGQIVTVQEAAKNPQLETQFYTQQKLLENMYGLDDQTSARTLDLLSKLETATKSGDEDLTASLTDQLQNSMQQLDATIPLQEKANTFLAGIMSGVMLQNENLMLLGRDSLGKAMLGGLENTAGGGADKLKELSAKNQELISRMSEFAKSNKTMDLEKMSEMIALGRGPADLPNDGKSIPYSAGEAASSTDSSDARDESLSGKIDKLVGSVGDLVTLLRENATAMKNANVNSVGKGMPPRPGGVGSNAVGYP